MGDGNWVSLKSVDADSKLLCKSSKFTEGRKSKDVGVFSFTSSLGGCTPFLPKENKEWLLEDDALSIGESEVSRDSEWSVTGLWLVLPLFLMIAIEEGVYVRRWNTQSFTSFEVLPWIRDGRWGRCRDSKGVASMGIGRDTN